MWSNNRQINAYLEPRPLKAHEQRQLQIIHDSYDSFPARVLDIGCGPGALLASLSRAYPESQLVGLDVSPDLLRIAESQLSGKNIQLIQGDAFSYEPEHKFDMIVASGILSVYEDFEPVLDRWLSWLKGGAKLFIFGPFNTRDVDTIIRFRNNRLGGNWESGLTSYSLHTVSRFLEGRVSRFHFERFSPDFELPEQDDPIRNWTVKGTDGSIRLVNGANVISEYHFLTIEARGLL